MGPFYAPHFLPPVARDCADKRTVTDFGGTGRNAVHNLGSGIFAFSSTKRYSFYESIPFPLTRSKGFASTSKGVTCFEEDPLIRRIDLQLLGHRQIGKATAV